jgi:prepilin peptidase CpaA
VHHAVSIVTVLIGILTIVGLAVLVLAALHDFAVRTVPNAYSVILFGAGAAIRLCAGGAHALQWGLIAAAVIFAATVLFWRLGWMGGGDVKLLTSAAIFVPTMLVPTLVAATALAGGVLAIVFILGRKFAVRPAAPRPHAVLARVLRCEQWRLHRGGPLPYAAAIATGGVIATLHG